MSKSFILSGTDVPKFYKPPLKKFSLFAKIVVLILLCSLPFAVNAQERKSINEQFNAGLPTTWTNVNVSGSVSWAGSGTTHSGSAGSAYHAVGSAAGSNSYLVMPQLLITDANSELVFWSYITNWGSNSGGGVYLSTTGNDPGTSTFVELKNFSNAEDRPNNTWKEITISLSEYVGKIVYIAFRYVGTNANSHTCNVDDITIWDAVYVVNAKAPQISAQPIRKEEVAKDGVLNISVTATSPDGGTLSYQWYQNTTDSNVDGTPIENADQKDFKVFSDVIGTYYYYAVVTNTLADNGDGGVKSATAKSNVSMIEVTVGINARFPSISTQPQPATVNKDAALTVSVAATRTDDGTLSYQWYSNTTASNQGGSEMSGATSATFVVPTDVAGTHYYYAVVTNTIEDNGDGGDKSMSTASNPVTITVVDKFFYEGFDSTFPPAGWSQINNTGVVWTKADGRNSTGSAYHNQASTKVTTLVTKAIAIPETGSYALRFWSKGIGSAMLYAGSVTADVMVSTDGESGTFTVLKPLVYTQIPTSWVEVIISLSDYAGKTIHLGFRYNNNPGTTNFQWNIDDVEIFEQVVAETPVISQAPQSVSVSLDASASLSVTAGSTDGGTLKYQWYKNTTNSNTGGVAISGETTPVYEAPTNVVGTYYYYVVVTNEIANNGDGGQKTATATSAVATVTVSVASLLSEGFEGSNFPPTGWSHINTAGTGWQRITTPAGFIHSGSGSARKANSFTDTETILVTPAFEIPNDGKSYEFRFWSRVASYTSGKSYCGIMVSTTVGNDAGAFTEVKTVSMAVGGWEEVIISLDAYAGQTIYFGFKFKDGDNLNWAIDDVIVAEPRITAKTPVITEQPEGADVLDTAPVLLSIEVEPVEGGSLTYQWYKNTTASATGGTLIQGATEATYSVNTGVAGTYYFYVVVTNTIFNNGDGGKKTATVTSDAVTVTVTARVFAKAPVIGTQPRNLMVNQNAAGSISVAASSPDGGVLSYQWYSNTTASNAGGVEIEDANKAAFNVPTDEIDTYYYYVKITNTISDNGDGATKTASVVSEVATVTVRENKSLFFESFEDSFPPEGWSQLTLNGTGTWGRVTTSAYVHSGIYAARCGNTSYANLENMLFTKAISIPDDGTDYELTFYSRTTGYGSASYCGVMVSTTVGNDPEAFTELASVSTQTDVFVSLNEYAGQTIYIAFKLKDNSMLGWAIDDVLIDVSKIRAKTPVFEEQPTNVTLRKGEDAVLNVVVAEPVDGGALTYQWYRNTANNNTGGTVIAGATSKSYKANTEELGSVYYFVAVTNTIADNGDGGAKTTTTRSAVATVTVNAWEINATKPVINTQPQSVTALLLSELNPLSVTAQVSDGGTLTYQWYSNNVASTTGGEPTAIEDATEKTLEISSAEKGVFYFFVVVTNTIEDNEDGGEKTATVTSSVATVTINMRNAKTPTITAQPTDVEASKSSKFTLSVTATNNDSDGALTYQWFINEESGVEGGVAIEDATEAKYEGVQNANGEYFYYVVVTNTIDEGAAVENHTASLASRVAKVSVRSADTYTFFEDFEATTDSNWPPEGWTIAKSEVSGTTMFRWDRQNDSPTAQFVRGKVSAGHTRSVPLTSDWLITPMLTVGDAEENPELSFFVNGQNIANMASPAYNGVWISTVGNDTTTFVELQKVEGIPQATSAQNWKEIIVSLAEYANQNVWIAFKFVGGEKATITGSGGHSWWVDDIKVSGLTLTENAAKPQITAQPQGATIALGAAHSISVTANSTDGGTLSYQWYRNGTNSIVGGTPVEGAVGDVFEVPADISGLYYYYVAVTNEITDNGDGGKKTATVTSAVAVIEVESSEINAKYPVITAQPRSATVIKDASVTISVTATCDDDGEVTYQWYSNATASNEGGELIPEATGSAYKVPTDEAGINYYYVVITNTIEDNDDGGRKTATTVSEVATVTVTVVATLLSENFEGSFLPAGWSQIVIKDGIQWSKSGGRNSTGAAYHNNTPNGETTTLVTPAVTIPDDGIEYELRFWSSGASGPMLDMGYMSAEIMVSTDGASGTFEVIKPLAANQIATAWVEVIVPLSDYAGKTIHLGFNYKNPSGYSLRWSIDDVVVAEPKVHVQAPIISEQPEGDDVLDKSPVVLSVTAESFDGGELTYQWYSNTTASATGGTLIQGATEATYSVNTEEAGTFYFYVVVTNTISDNGDGGQKTASVTSEAVMVTVTMRVYAQKPVIATQPHNLTLNQGAEGSIRVVASSPDKGELTYQWFSNTTASNEGGVEIEDATQAVFTVPSDVINTYYYYVEITNTIEDNEDGALKTATLASNIATVVVREDKGLLFESFEDSFLPEGWNQLKLIGTAEWGRVTNSAYVHSGIYAARCAASNASLENMLITKAVSIPNDGTDYELTFYSRVTTYNASTSHCGVMISTTVGDDPEAFTELVSISDQSSVFISLNEYAGQTIYIAFKLKDNSSTSSLGWAIDDVSIDIPKIRAAAPVIEEQPTNVTVKTGENAVLTVAAAESTDGALTYQWYRNTANNNTGGTAIAGATSVSYKANTEELGTVYYFVAVTNTIADNGDGGAKTSVLRSAVASVTVNSWERNAQKPVINTQPQNVTVLINSEKPVLTVMASKHADDADGTLTYQWYSTAETTAIDGVPIEGATTNTLEVATDVTGKFYFYVVATTTIPDNGDGGIKTATVTSNLVTVTISLRDAKTPTIARQPFDVATSMNVQFTLSVQTANNDVDGTLTHQWYINNVQSVEGGHAIEGATHPDYSGAHNVGGSYYYYVVVTNTIEKTDIVDHETASITSNIVKVSVRSEGALKFTEDFENTDDGNWPPEGWTIVLNEVEGTTMSRWGRQDNSLGSNFVRGKVSAYHSRSINITSDWLITPMLALGGADENPELSFFVNGQGIPNMAYPAYDGVWISTVGTDTTTFVELYKVEGIPQVTLAQNWKEIIVSLAQYANQNVWIAFKFVGGEQATISGSGGHVWWIDDIKVEGLRPVVNAVKPEIIAQPQGSTIIVDSEHNISVTANASDGGALTYQWYANDKNSVEGATLIEGATAAVFTVSTVAAGTYFYYVTILNTIEDNGDGGIKTASVASQVAMVTVRIVAQAPVITTQPQNVTSGKGAAVTLTVVATSPDGGELSYQWYRTTSATNTGGSPLQGATEAGYTLPTSITNALGTYYYYVQVTNTLVDGENTSTARTSSNPVTVIITNATGNETIAVNPLRAWTRDGLLHVSGLTAGEPLSVYSVGGALVYRSVVTSDEVDIQLAAKGVLILTNGNNVIRVVFE